MAFQIKGSRKPAAPSAERRPNRPTDSSQVLLLAFEIYIGRSDPHKSFEVEDQAPVLDRPDVCQLWIAGAVDGLI